MADDFDIVDIYDVAPPPDNVASVWIKSETGIVHMGCSRSVESGQASIDRYTAAGIAIGGELGECCQVTGDACLFDVFGDIDQIDEVVTLAWALMRAEGRQGDPPYRCATHGALTFGGCCG